MAIANDLQWITDDHISTALRQQTGDTGASVINWTPDRLFGAGEALGIWRLTGHAVVNGGIQQWSIVIKGWSAPQVDENRAAFNWPHREMELYRSGLLADLPGGIRAPECYGSFRGADGSIWIWLEDITDGINGLETQEAFAVVARRLGQYNGAWPAEERPLPEHPALSDSWTRRWTDVAGPSLEQMAQLADHPLVQRVYPTHILDTYRRVWKTRHAGYALLERVPKTFAHLDVFPRNIFVRDGPGTPTDIVLIDWSFAGIAGLGEEIGPLIMATAIYRDATIMTIDDLQDLVVDAYLDGLRDAGWRGDYEAVVNAYRVSSGLRYGPGVVRVALPILLGESPREDVEAIFGISFDAILDLLAEFHEWLTGQIREHEHLFN